jgi:serine/threonine-protein kinase
MSDENKSGTDLDIFEGLGKKNAKNGAASAAPPPPPSAMPKGPEPKKTLLGVAIPQPPPPPPSAAPPPPPPVSAAPPPPPPVSAAPPPPPPAPAASVPPPIPGTASSPPPIPGAPGAAAKAAPAQTQPIVRPSAPPARKSLPAISVPPVKPGSTPPAAAEAKPEKRSKKSGGGIDMDWDDEDEATHVFDKDKKDDDDPDATEISDKGAASLPDSFPKAGSATLVGMSAQLPPPPPPLKSAPPGPPPALGSAGLPPPPPPGPGSIRPSVPPPPVQTHTAPMPMPGPKPPSAAPPPPAPQASAPPPSTSPASQPPSIPASQMTSRAMEQTALVTRAQPEQSKTGLVVGLVAGVAVVAGLAVFFLMPRTGSMAVNVTDSKGGPVSRVSVFVDGTAASCQVAPCIIEKLSAGVHQVKVEADGYEIPAPKAVNVNSGQSGTVDFALVSGGKGGSGFKIASNQAGVKVYVDDKEIGPLPQEVRDLPPGEHTIKLSGSDRYAVLEKKITVAKGEVQDLSLPLKVLKGKATINLGTAGAKVYLVSGSDRREFPTLPISVDLDPAKPWVLEATKTGFTDYHQAISFDDGQAEKTFTVTLDPKGAPAGAGAATTTPPATTGATTAAPTATTAPASTGTAKPAAAGEAFLTINSTPVSNVVLDSKPLGQTPKVKVPVTPGSHTIMLVNSEESLKKTVTITVKAGETKPVIVKLRE